MIGGHVEGPHPFLDLEARCGVRNKKAGDPAGIAILAAGAREHRAMRGDMHAGDPHLLAIDAPAGNPVTRLAHRPGFHPGGLFLMVGFVL